jgi:hypothetical protein
MKGCEVNLGKLHAAVRQSLSGEQANAQQSLQASLSAAERKALRTWHQLRSNSAVLSASVEPVPQDIWIPAPQQLQPKG